MNTQNTEHGEKNRPVEQPIRLPDSQGDGNVARELLMPHKNMKKEPRPEHEVQTFQNEPQTIQVHKAAQQLPQPKKDSLQVKIPLSLPILINHGQEGSPDTAKDSTEDQLFKSRDKKQVPTTL